MENALEIKGLCKQYEGFALENVSFTLPRGAVMGFIGENGAGKTTTIKSILHLIHRDAGEIRVLGLDNEKDERAVKERIGVVLEDGCFLNTMNARQVDTLMGKAYKSWQSAQFFGFMKRFGIDERKKIKDYSKGMRMKISIAAALSHGAELLIMDEPTSGLDPVVRDEILDIFQEFIQDEEHSVLISSHITSELEKVADYITFIHKGEIFLSEEKDRILEEYGIVRCRPEDVATIDDKMIIGVSRGTYSCDVLVNQRERLKQQHPDFIINRIKLEDVLIFKVKGDK